MTEQEIELKMQDAIEGAKYAKVCFVPICGKCKYYTDDHFFCTRFNIHSRPKEYGTGVDLK